MPEGTKVKKLFKALKAEGKSDSSAARIAQAKTGMSLKTGKPSMSMIKKRKNGKKR